MVTVYRDEDIVSLEACEYLLGNLEYKKCLKSLKDAHSIRDPR